MGWAVTQRITFMTCTQCVIIMGPCRGDITQVTNQFQQPATDELMNISKIFIIFYCVFLAHCKNSIDGQWYCFDDSDVHPMSEDEVCKQTGYILFYQRRATIPSWSANSSVGGNFC